SPDLFHAFDVPVVSGRPITDEDTPTSLITAVVNQALVQRFFPDSNPLGARVRIGPNPKAAWRTIVGVVGDMHQNGPEAPAAPEIYLPLAQDTFSDLSLVARTAGDPLALASSVRGIVTSIDPQLPVIEMTTMEKMAGERLASRRLLMLLLVVFACMAL